MKYIFSRLIKASSDAVFLDQLAGLFAEIEDYQREN